MFRSLAMLPVLALGLTSALAQETAPATPAAPAPLTQPAPADVVIEPAAPIGATTKQDDLMTGFFATMAVIEICAIEVPAAIKDGMTGDQKRLEASVGLDANTAAIAYSKVKSAVQQTAPDCTPGSADLASVEAVTKIYADAATEKAAVAPDAAAAPAAAEPAVTPAPAAQ